MKLIDSFARAAKPTKSKRFAPPKGLTAWPPVSAWTDAHWTHWLKGHKWKAADITQYLDHDRYAYGFGVLNGGLATVKDAKHPGAIWLYRPTPKGCTLHANRLANLMWGGSAGGTKSFSARWELWRCAFDPMFADRPEGGYRAILARRELEQLRRTHLDKFDREARRICLALEDDRAIKVTTQPPVVSILATDAKIICAHAHNKGDEEKYLSEDYDDFVGDEASWLLPDQITGFQGRVRNDTKNGRVGRMMLTTNPGGPSHDFIVQHFITKTVSRLDEPKYDPDDYTYQQASLYDNPYYMDADGTYTTYEKRLSMYKVQRRQQLLDGDWSTVVGQFFESFDSRLHVKRAAIPPGTSIEVWFRSGVGGKIPYACVVALLPDGRLYIVGEQLFPHQTIAETAIDVVRFMRDKVIPETRGKWARSVGSPDLFPSEALQGEAPSETCRRYGWYLQKGDEHETFGWDRLRHWLRPHPTADTPWLIIDPDCAFVARTLPTVVSDPELPDKLDEHSDTQGVHALRLGVMARPSPSILTVPKPPVPPDSPRAWLDKELSPRRQLGMVR